MLSVGGQSSAHATQSLERFSLSPVLPGVTALYCTGTAQEIPHTATGKVSKLALRKIFANHQPKARTRSKL